MFKYQDNHCLPHKNTRFWNCILLYYSFVNWSYLVYNFTQKYPGKYLAREKQAGIEFSPG